MSMWERVAILVTRWPVLSRSQCMATGCMHIIRMLRNLQVDLLLGNAYSTPQAVLCATSTVLPPSSLSHHPKWHGGRVEQLCCMTIHNWILMEGAPVTRTTPWVATHCRWWCLQTMQLYGLLWVTVCVYYLIVLVFTQYQILLLCQLCCHNPAPVTIKWLMSSYTQSNYKCR